MFFISTHQVSREDFIVTMYYHNHRPLTFDIFGRRRGPQGEGREASEGAKDPAGDIPNLTPHAPSSGETRKRSSGETRKPSGETQKPSSGETQTPSSGETRTDDIFRAFEFSGKTHVDFSIFGLHDSEVPLESYDLRVTLVWAPLASQVMPPTAKERIEVVRLKEWAEQEVIPDIIVFGQLKKSIYLFIIYY